MLDTQFEKTAEQAAEQKAQEQQAKQLDSMFGKDGSITLTNLDGEAVMFKPQTFPTYKTAQVLQLLASIKDEIDLVDLISEIQILAKRADAADDTAQARKILAAFNAIPKLIEVAPNLLLEFAALAIIPNKELRQAYDDGSLSQLRSEKRKYIEFEFDASVPVFLFSAYIPYLGLDFLRQAFSTLNLNAAKTLNNLV